MTHPIGMRLPACTLRLALVFGLAAVTLGGMLVAPAYAENDQTQNQNTRGNQGRQHAVQQRHWQGQRGNGGYYPAPDVDTARRR